jgi:hypothetical protein
VYEATTSTVFTSADDEIVENRNMFAGLVIRHSGVTVRNCFMRARLHRRHQSGA